MYSVDSGTKKTIKHEHMIKLSFVPHSCGTNTKRIRMTMAGALGTYAYIYIYNNKYITYFLQNGVMFDTQQQDLVNQSIRFCFMIVDGFWFTGMLVVYIAVAHEKFEHIHLAMPPEENRADVICH
jgi:hypothetical protein